MRPKVSGPAGCVGASSPRGADKKFVRHYLHDTGWPIRRRGGAFGRPAVVGEEKPRKTRTRCRGIKFPACCQGVHAIHGGGHARVALRTPNGFLKAAGGKSVGLEIAARLVRRRCLESRLEGRATAATISGAGGREAGAGFPTRRKNSGQGRGGWRFSFRAWRRGDFLHRRGTSGPSSACWQNVDRLRAELRIRGGFPRFEPWPDASSKSAVRFLSTRAPAGTPGSFENVARDFQTVGESSMAELFRAGGATLIRAAEEFAWRAGTTCRPWRRAKPMVVLARQSIRGDRTFVHFAILRCNPLRTFLGLRRP